MPWGNGKENEPVHIEGIGRMLKVGDQYLSLDDDGCWYSAREIESGRASANALAYAKEQEGTYIMDDGDEEVDTSSPVVGVVDVAKFDWLTRKFNRGGSTLNVLKDMTEDPTLADEDDTLG